MTRRARGVTGTDTHDIAQRLSLTDDGTMAAQRPRPAFRDAYHLDSAKGAAPSEQLRDAFASGEEAGMRLLNLEGGK